MLRASLETALTETRKILAQAITTATYEGKKHKDGQEAKNAAIRSQSPIRKLHQVVGDSVFTEISSKGIRPSMWPPVGKDSPELSVTGLLKAKKQDIAITVESHKAEKITTGVQKGSVDPIGYNATNRALVIGIRSQLSSIEKNFDTLAERAFAETLNLSLRCPNITLGEVYLIPLNEFDDSKLKSNKMGFKSNPVNVAKFVRFFNAITHLSTSSKLRESYQYSATTLIVADFSQSKVRVLWDKADVTSAFGKEMAADMTELLPDNFVKRISKRYVENLNRP
jgi:hypothetical protein